MISDRTSLILIIINLSYLPIQATNPNTHTNTNTSAVLPFSSGKGVSSMGLPWERNWDELCDRFCLAFLTDFRENPSTLSTDGDVVAAEDIALQGGTHRGVGERLIDHIQTWIYMIYFHYP